MPLARLGYADFEVLVIAHTSRRPVWRPVEAHCAQLGARFRFFHVAPLAGFKAGALNYALARTAPDAEIIAVIDSDYVVDARWLRELMPGFPGMRGRGHAGRRGLPRRGTRAPSGHVLRRYRGFFTSHDHRNERNAIIQHGTMTMVRREQLASCGGWAQWCITEDAELGLRHLRAGFDAS